MHPATGNPVRGRLRDQTGAVAVFVALLTPALLLIFLLVIDVGNWYVHKRHLQMQTDAAALTGGAYFRDCFSIDPTVAGAANTTIKSAATAYAGQSGSTYNFQVGGGSPRVTTLFNSATFARGSYVDPDVETQQPCQTPHLMLDVKQTEEDVPYVLGALVDALVPGSPTVVPAINARARVALKQATIVQGGMPLAVPDVAPTHVTVTLVNEADGSLLAGPFELTKGASANGLNYWSGPASLTVPAAGAMIAVRIGLGRQSATCAGPNGTGGSGFVCYDYSNTSSGLALIDGVGSGGTVNQPKPRVWATTSCAPTGAPFFGGQNLVAPATTCQASIQAVLQTSSGTVGPASAKTFTATLNGAGLKNATAPFTYDAASGYWTTGYAFAAAPDGGPVDVTLNWQSTSGGKQTYAGIQRVYSAAEDDSGPVKELSVSTATPTAGAPYTLSSGSHTLTVSVGVQVSLDLALSSQTTMLRLTGGSRTSAVACDGTGASDFRNAIVNGCQTPYQVNSVGYCPDPSPPAGPDDCIQTKTGTTAGPTLQGLDERFAACPADNWPDYDTDTDPRVVKLMITDFSSLGGSGTTLVPVTNFAGFYITGWTGSTCGNNGLPPPNVDIKKGAIWGHFVKYIAPSPFDGGGPTCDALALTPCIPILVK
jgi:Putative Flp pilus-assembly TadE/G-like